MEGYRKVTLTTARAEAAAVKERLTTGSATDKPPAPRLAGHAGPADTTGPPTPAGPTTRGRHPGPQPELDLGTAERRPVDLHAAAGRLGHPAGDVEAEAGRADAAAAAPQRGMGIADSGPAVGEEDQHHPVTGMQGHREPGAL